MANKYKVILLIVLTGLALILSSTIFALEFLLHRRKHLLKVLKSKQKNQKQQQQQLTQQQLQDAFQDAQSKPMPAVSWSRTIKNSYPMNPSEMSPNMIHNVAHSRLLSADAHLSLALSALPFEQSDNAIPPKLYHAETIYPRGVTFVQEEAASSSHGKQQGERPTSTKQMSQSGFSSSPPTESSIQEALWHLEQASELGNPDAQNMLANILASGILPVEDQSSWRMRSKSNRNVSSPFLEVPSDFAMGGQQLARALVLWHLSAMGGNIEAAMALGYRHYISATSGDDPSKLVMEEEEENGDMKGGHSRDYRLNRRRDAKSMRHSAVSSAHYGVLGTCETSLAYYEAAANGIMDELELGPLRGKVAPARDHHKLAEIHQRGASSKLAQYNKPDELDEALKYFKIRANNVHNPDLGAAHKLASMYHYGLKGVKQDLREALKYYEIAADFNSWEAAGQAGQFHLFGMGVDGHERNLKKALEYFKMGTPGGLSGCKLRFLKKSQSKERTVDELLWGMGEMTYNCDHSSVNGMGLLHLYGIPMMIAPNITRAIEYFELAKSMGNMDACFNLAMMKLGWMNPFFGTSFDYVRGVKLDAPLHKTSPTTNDYMDAMNLLKRAESMGHIQAKHRLAMMYSRGLERNGTIIVPKNCPKALKLNRDIAMTGTTISKRLRAAYKQYMAGNYDASLRNYLAAAETGSVEAQVNAAFLLEQGTCLGMSRLNCLKASVRMWRAAARQGDEEASLRVGDFYYYGRLREDLASSDDVLNAVSLRDIDFSTAPFPWIRYVLYPEDILPKVKKQIIKVVKRALSNFGTARNNVNVEESQDMDDFCSDKENKNKSSCLTLNDDAVKEEATDDEDHFQIAARYYKKAAYEHGSARANFNLGFMHEWGLGLTQDFPLAKRFYDIAAISKGGEGALAVQIALTCMNIHEFMVKTGLSMEKWYREKRNRNRTGSNSNSSSRYRQYSNVSFEDGPTTVRDIIFRHVFAVDSVVIGVLVILLIALARIRHDRHHDGL